MPPFDPLLIKSGTGLIRPAPSLHLVPATAAPAEVPHPDTKLPAGWRDVPLINLMWRKRTAAVSIVDRAAALAAEGRTFESDMLFRLAFARGERDPRIEKAIDRITDEAIAVVEKVTLRTHPADLKDCIKETTIDNAAAARDLFEEALGSRLTLMDVVELLDIAAPLFTLTELRLSSYISEDGAPALTISCIYTRDESGVSQPECAMDFEFHAGKPVIVRRNLSIADEFKRLAIGTRRLLRTVEFAKLHGIERWEDNISEDGIFVWPRLGARLTRESLEYVLSKLEKLAADGIVKHLDLNAANPDEIAAIMLHEEDILNEDALKLWYRSNARIRPSDIEQLSAPYRVGLAALRGSVIYADFVPERIAHELLTRHIPRHLRSGLISAEKKTRLDERHLNRIADAEAGLAEDFSRALMREWTMFAEEPRKEGEIYTMETEARPAGETPADYQEELIQDEEDSGLMEGPAATSLLSAAALMKI